MSGRRTFVQKSRQSAKMSVLNKLKPKPKKIRTWPTVTAEVDLSLSTASSPSHGVGSPPLVSSLEAKHHRIESCWYQKVSICRLECPSKGVQCQGVIVRLSPELRSALEVEESLPVALALITSHSHLHSKAQLKEWKMHVGMDNSPKPNGFKLSEKHFSHFYTCCGPEGVWEKSEMHTGSFVDESTCPFQANFSVLILKHSLTEQLLKRDLTIPLVPLLDESSFSQILHSSHFTLIQRGSFGVAEAHKVYLCPSSALFDEASVEETIAVYTETSQLRYTCDHIDFFDAASTGAGIVYFDQSADDYALKLAAIHMFSRRDDDAFVHCGISVPAIFHAIAGNLVCGIIPSLSLLVGACRQGVWIHRFYQSLQDCLHPQNDPKDKQKHYHWASLVLRVCDFLIRDEPQVVLRLELSERPQVVQSSLSLLSAVLSCFERVINLEGVTQFHCQVSRVFPKKGTERFYKGLENTFRQLYKQLGSPKSSNEVIMLCTECWLKMCALGGTVSSLFYDAAKFSRVKALRDSPRFQENSHMQRLFGDLCLAFLTHTRVTLHERSAEEVDSPTSESGRNENRRKIHQLQQEKEALQQQVESLSHELLEKAEVLDPHSMAHRIPNGEDPELKEEVEEESPVSPGAHYTVPAVTVTPVFPQSPQKQITTLLRSDSEKTFWERDMGTLMENDVQLRKKIGQVFQKVKGAAGNGTWEHLVHHLEQKLQVTEESFMDLAELESLNLSSGDVVLQIVQEWARREEVTLSHFCNVSRELGNSRVQGILSEMEQADIDRKLPAFVQQSPRNSRVTSI